MKFYNIIMKHKRHISKKLIWNGTENRSETCYFTTGLIRMILHIFCATSNQFFWYVPFMYHYYIIEFHHLGLDRLSKKFDVDAHIRHTFCDNFWNLKKNSKSYGRTRMFLSDFSIFSTRRLLKESWAKKAGHCKGSGVSKRTLFCLIPTNRGFQKSTNVYSKKQNKKCFARNPGDKFVSVRGKKSLWSE